jgi:hypothetical protein
MTDGLATLRTIFFAVLTSTILLGVVALVVTTTGEFGGGTIDVFVGIAAVLAAGLGATFASATVAPALDCSTPQRLAGTYRTRFIIRLAFAETPMLLAFVAAVVTANPLVYLAGVPFAALAFARVAPTQTNLEREQDELVLRGCGTSLDEALRGR